MEYCVYWDFKGWSAEVWAAWAQALLSVVAIVAAGRFGVLQHRREIGQRVGAVVALLAHAADVADEYLSMCQDALGGTSAKDWNIDMLERIQNSLAGIMVHELPDEGLVHPVLSAADAVSDLTRFLTDTIGSARNGFKLMSHGVDECDTLATVIRASYDLSVIVDRQHRPLTLHDRLKFRLFLGKSEKQPLT